MYWTTLLIRCLAGGLLVAAMSLLAEMIVPKRLAGVFAGMPSVAIASLLLTVIKRGPGPLPTLGVGMTVGALAFIAYVFTILALTTRFHPRLHPLPGSFLGWMAWFVVAGAGILVVSL